MKPFQTKSHGVSRTYIHLAILRWDANSSNFQRAVGCFIALVTCSLPVNQCTNVNNTTCYIICIRMKADLDLRVSDSGLDSTQLIATCSKLVKYSVKTGHPRFFNLLYSGLDPAALGASWLTESLNCNGWNIWTTFYPMIQILNVSTQYIHDNFISLRRRNSLLVRPRDRDAGQSQSYICISQSCFHLPSGC
jgi:Pyridoxal-dependent decarboxylase conserved domain